MIAHIFKVEGRTLTEADMDALIMENIGPETPLIQRMSLSMIAGAITDGFTVTLDGKPVTRENA